MIKTKTRPLWQISDFVINELPNLLANNNQSIFSKIKNILENIDGQQLAESYRSDRELVLLDLKFVEVALIRKSMDVPEILTNTVDFFCGNGANIPGLQYHELIEINPQEDMRTFSTGEIRKSEILFYNSHRLMEQRLHQLIVICEEFLSDSSHNSQLIQSYDTLFDYQVIAQLMNGLRNMPPGHFPVFREYITSPCPVRNFDGPSGAYSWRIPYLELLVWGHQLAAEYREDIKSKIKYYSPEGRDKLTSKLESSNPYGIVNYVDEMDEMVIVVRTFINFMRSFRESHLRAVAKQLPDAIKNTIAGTSGNPTPGTFLKNRMHAMEEIYLNFEKKYPFK